MTGVQDRPHTVPEPSCTSISGQRYGRSRSCVCCTSAPPCQYSAKPQGSGCPCSGPITTLRLSFRHVTSRLMSLRSCSVSKPSSSSSPVISSQEPCPNDFGLQNPGPRLPEEFHSENVVYAETTFPIAAHVKNRSRLLTWRLVSKRRPTMRGSSCRGSWVRSGDTAGRLARSFFQR